MPALNQDLTIYKDSHLNISFIFTDYNPSNATAIWVVKNVNGEELLSKSTADGIFALSDKLVVSIEPSDTVNLIAGSYSHELRITTLDLETAPVSVGKVTIKEVLTASVY
jgi:hypothetical protein